MKQTKKKRDWVVFWLDAAILLVLVLVVVCAAGGIFALGYVVTLPAGSIPLVNRVFVAIGLVVADVYAWYTAQKIWFDFRNDKEDD